MFKKLSSYKRNTTQREPVQSGTGVHNATSNIAKVTPLQAQFNKTFTAAQTSKDPLEQYELGRLYELGVGIEIDMKQANDWYQTAFNQLDAIRQRAANGEAKAQICLWTDTG